MTDPTGPQPAVLPFGASDSILRHLLDTLPAAAYTCDTAGLITYYNPRAAELWGRHPALNDPTERFCGSLRLLTAAGETIPHDECWMALALRNGHPYNGEELVIERPDGSRWTTLAHANPFFDGDGHPCGAVNVLIDITDRKRAEDALHEADRRKNEFLAVLAHELRNPLAPIRNGLHILKNRSGDDPAAIAAREMMERQLSNMVRLIDDLLDISRLSRGKIELRPARINLSDVLHDAIETSQPLLDNAGTQLTLQLPDEVMWVDADRTRLAQAFSNLLNNSAKYSERDGQIQLTVHRDGDQVVVSVRDHGAGIPQEMLSRIFDLFTQVEQRSAHRPRSGQGIGLNLARGLMELHGGSLRAFSDGPGTGSEFTARLPAAVSTELESTPMETPAGVPEANARYRILVVDDNADSAESMAVLLQIVGHEVQTAFDGSAAVDAAVTYRPDVVLLDLGLPVLNGYEVCRRIRSLPWGGQVVVIALTGWGQEENKRSTLEAGFDFHLVKPVEAEALEALLDGLRARITMH